MANITAAARFCDLDDTILKSSTIADQERSIVDGASQLMLDTAIDKMTSLFSASMNGHIPPLPQGYKTIYCRNALVGSRCKYGAECSFAHTAVVRVAAKLLTNPRFLQTPCSGNHGQNCPFVHEGELILIDVETQKFGRYQPPSSSASRADSSTSWRRREKIVPAASTATGSSDLSRSPSPIGAALLSPVRSASPEVDLNNFQDSKQAEAPEDMAAFGDDLLEYDDTQFPDASSEEVVPGYENFDTSGLVSQLLDELRRS